MNSESIFIVGFIFFLCYGLHLYNKDHNETLRNYYVCKDVKTKQYLIPLTAQQYNNLENTYTDFKSMYICDKKQYTRYHVDLMQKKK